MSAGNLPKDVSVPYNPEDDEPANAAEDVKRRHEEELLGLPGVTGVGVGRGPVGDDAIVVYLKEQSEASRIPGTIEGIPVVTEVTSDIEAY